MLSISEQKQDLQIQTFFKYRIKRAIETFEEATEKGKYDYWLMQEDIADIARIKYNYFRDSSIPGLAEFEILGSLTQLNRQLERFQSTQPAEARLTFIINLRDQHWVTLVISRRDLLIEGVYVDSQGHLLAGEYYEALRKFNVIINDFSLHFVQQTDDYNCGLWALENAADINKMLNLRESLNWLTYQLKFPRNRFYFNVMRQTLLSKFYLDVVRRERFHPNSIQSERELPEKSEASHSLESNEPSSKRVKVQVIDKRKVELHLEKFVGSFIAYFQQKLSVYHLIARGEKLTISALKQELKTGTTGALFGLIVSRSVTGIIPSLVVSLRTVSHRYYISKSKAQKITRFFSEIQSGGLSNILAEAAVKIFSSYEAQFMQMTDKAGAKIAMEKLAEDAVARALNYISEKDTLVISVETISKGIILGNSDKYFDPNLKKFRLSISGNAIQDLYANKIYTADLYEKVGLVIFIAGSARFYRKIGLSEEEAAHYGYRNALSWEKTTVNSLTGDYTQNYEQVTPSQIGTGLRRDLQNYEYSLNLVVTQRKAQEIVTKITSQHQDASVAKPTVKKAIIFNLRAPVENFVGRVAALDSLHEILLAGRTPTIISAISAVSLNSAATSVLTSGSQSAVNGLGGIGKTQLVLRYAQLHAADYDNNVLWINSETKADLLRSFFKLATKLAIETKDRYGETKNIESLIDEIYDYFSDTKSLFIFDNVENYQEIESFLPKLMLGNKPHILITSRYKNWQNAANDISLDVFTEQEALALVKHGLSINNSLQDTKIIELNILMQGLPLALQQAIAYIQNQKNSNSEFSVETYIQIFKTKSREILDFNFRKYSNDPYLKTVYTTWQITLDTIKKEGRVGEIAIEILNIMSFLFPENISAETFSTFYDTELLNSAIGLLRIYSMMNAGSISSEYVMHRLVQKVINIQLENNPYQFRKLALKAEALVMYYAKNMDTRFHYIHFLFNIVDHPELEEDLQFKTSFKRISSILMIDDVKMWNYFLDIAYSKFIKEKYIECLTICFLNYRKLASPFYVLNLLGYIEKKLLEGILTKSDIQLIVGNQGLINNPEYRVNYLSTMPEKREAQLYIVLLISSFRKKIFPDQRFVSCSSDRKKRSGEINCLQKKQALKEEKQRKVIKHLQNVRHIAVFTSTGLFAKDTLAAILRGDFRGVAINFGLLLSGSLFEGLSNVFLAQGEKLSADEIALLQKELALENKAALNIFFHEGAILSGKKKLLAKTLKMASPFIARGTSIFFTYNLINDITKYNSGATNVLSSIVSNGAIVAIDGVAASIEAAELLEIITGVSEFTGPVGEGAVVLIWLGSEAYETNKGLNAIEKSVDLAFSDKFIQGIRLFLGMGSSEYIELKAKNNQLIQHTHSFLKEHREVKRYVFSASYTQADLYTRSEVHLDNKFNLTLSDNMPDAPSDSQLFCVSGIQTATHSLFHLGVPKETFNSYVCKKALGIEYSVNRTGNATLIALDKGDSKVIVVSQTPTIFLVSDGHKEYKGNDKVNLFIILGKKVTGTLEGGNGTDLLSLSNFYSNTSTSVLIDRKRFLCEKILTPSWILPQCSSQNKVALKNINQIYGQANKKEVIYLTKDITLVDGKGGENETFPDIIYVTNESEAGLKIFLRSNTEVKYLDSNLAPYPVDYVISSAQQDKAQVNFPFCDNIQLRFFFDYFLENITAINVDNYQLQFNISSVQEVNFNKTFSLTLQNAVTNFSNSSSINSTLLPENVYYFFKDGVQIKILDENHIYAKVESVRTIDELLDSFIMAGNRLNKTFSVRLARNETISIGQKKNEILMSNCLAESYLIGNGGENIYSIVPLNTTLLPLPEVILYDVYDESTEEIEDFRDTLDLREVVKKINRVCSMQTLSTTLHQEGNDLIISINALYYLIGHECVQSGREWSAAVIRLLKGVTTEWPQKLDILLYDNRQQIIMYKKDKGWYLTDIPLTVDSDREIIVITNEDISQNSELAILKNMGNLTFLDRNRSDLIITNTQDEAISQDDFYTIICSQFYKLAEMREKVLSLTLLFLDQELPLKDYEEQINTPIPFPSVLNDSVSIIPSVLPLTVNTTRVIGTIRNKRQVSFEIEKPAASSTTKNFPPFFRFFNWTLEKASLFVSSVNDSVFNLNKKIFPSFHMCVENESKPLEDEMKYQKKMNETFYPKWNNFYKEKDFFTEVPDYQKARNNSIYLKHQANYRKAIFSENDIAYQATLFRSESFLSQVKANIDVNGTLVLADYLIRRMGKK